MELRQNFFIIRERDAFHSYEGGTTFFGNDGNGMVAVRWCLQRYE